jgi:1,4-alpha-glucan branching enzyme
MLQKKPLAGGKVEVTFRMPPLDDVVELSLCGDFNNWQVQGFPLIQESDGTWVAKLVLDAGKSYRFRYSDNQGRWHNDWEADAYVPNDFGSEDSVLDLMSVALKSHPRGQAAEKRAAPRKAAPRKSPPGKAADKGGKTPGHGKTTQRGK